MKKLFAVLTFFMLMVPTVSEAQEPKTMCLIYKNIAFTKNKDDEAKRDEMLNGLCAAMGTEMIDYSTGRRTAINYVTDNHIQVGMGGLPKGDMQAIGKQVGANYFVYITMMMNGVHGGFNPFHRSLKMDLVADMRIINVETGEEVLAESTAGSGRKIEFTCLEDLIEKAKADVKVKSLVFSKN